MGMAVLVCLELAWLNQRYVHGLRDLKYHRRKSAGQGQYDIYGAAHRVLWERPYKSITEKESQAF